MMQDPDANYFSTVSAFEAYWKNRPITKGCGWKPFKRWEYIMQGRISPNGKKPDAAKSIRAFQQYAGSNKSVSGTWISMGPSTIPSPGPAGYEGLGRLNVVAFHPTNADKIYVGAPSGGFWMSDNNGLNWTTTTDQLPSIGVSAIVIDYSNTNKILIGTGDRDHGDAPGIGVYKSMDGGLTWSSSNTGMGDVTVNKILQHPSSPLIFLAATNSGIFRTTDGGSNWSQTYGGNYSDIAFKPGDPSIVYAESNGNFYRSSNGGLGFTQITSGLSTGQRGAIAVSAANSNVVYFLQSNNDSGFQGLYKSTDAGLSFTTQSTSPNILDWSCDGSGTGGQGWYDLSVAADPSDANILYVGGVDVWKSTDGGVNWSINSHWYGGCSVPAVHADCHFLGFSPVTGRLYAGNDGGVYYSDDGGLSWTDCTVTMAIGQIYKIGQSQTNASKTINGFQDNGTYTLLSSGWVATGGGDGMECAVDQSNESYTYHTIYFGSVFRKYNNGNETQIAGNGVNGIDESGAWVTPFILSENNSQKMFIGYKNIWRSEDVSFGTPVWTKISSGEADDCSVLEQSPANVDILYVVRWGSLKRSDNANALSPSWVTCSLPGGFTPTDIEAHPTDPNTVYATAGYNVYKSSDKGITWNLVAGTLPGIPVNTLVYDKNSSEGLYIGTQTGVLYKDASITDWILFSAGLPMVDVRELEIFYDASNPANNRIMAATFGRGLWKSDLIETGPENPGNFSANTQSNNQINISWTRNANNNNVMLVWSPTASFGVPVPGTVYSPGSSIPGGAIVLARGSTTSYNHTSLSQGTTYYYKAWSYDASNMYSYGIASEATTFSPPAAAFVASNLSPALSEVITLTDLSAFTPTSWTWTISPSTYIFLNGTDETSQNPEVQFTELGLYTITLNVTNVWGSDTESKTDYLNVIPFSYCIPTYSYGSGAGDFISLVQLGDINNATTALPSPYYHYYADLSTDLEAGGNYTITLSPGTYGSGNHIAVWIDYDRNGYFEESEKLGTVEISPMPATGSIDFTVPESTFSGLTRMRVREVWVEMEFDACSNYGYGETEDYPVNIISSWRSVSLNLFLEGLFNGSTMNKARNETGDQYPGLVADQISVELHSDVAPYGLVAGPYTVDLNTSGSAVLSMPSSVAGNFYIVIRHRNSIETWSADPVLFSGSLPVDYDFKSSVSQSFGNNMKLIAGSWVLYGGDATQDGIVDGSDMAVIDNGSTLLLQGYNAQDVNGDGLVDGSDMALVDNNSTAVIHVVKP